MAKGDGSIYELGRGKWRVSVDFGKNPITAKRERITRVVNGSKVEARKVRDQIRSEHDNGLNIDAEKITFGEFSRNWQDARAEAGELSKRTIQDGRYIVNYLNDFIGGIKLKDITPDTVESLYSEIRKDKAKKGIDISGTTMLKFHVILKQIMQKAADRDLILRNPCDRVKAPKKADPKRQALTAAEGAQLLACISETEADEYAALEAKEKRQTERGNLFGRSSIKGVSTLGNIMAVRLGLATGMRLGEAFGLVWGNVTFDKSSLRIIQSLSNTGEIHPPKTKAGIRLIAIDAETVEHLKKWKKRQASELLKIGIKQNADTPVCCSDVGGWYQLNNFERWWRAWRANNGFPALKFHELRHTQATQLLANGVDVKTVQTRLGHSNAALTLNWYAHAIPENDQKAADLVGNLFADKPKATPIISVKPA